MSGYAIAPLGRPRGAIGKARGGAGAYQFAGA